MFQVNFSGRFDLFEGCKNTNNSFNLKNNSANYFFSVQKHLLILRKPNIQNSKVRQ